jgi:hypothetical protein
MSTKELAPGPYTSKRTVTLKVAPIDITYTIDEQASHVPAPCNCHGNSEADLSRTIMEALMGMASTMAASRQGTGPAADPTVGQE